MPLNEKIEKYDVYFIEPATTELGFMLAVDGKGTKQWQRDDKVGAPPLYAVGDYYYSGMPKEQKQAQFSRLRNSYFGWTMSPATRANTTAYTLGDVVILATPDGFCYECVTNGTSAGSEGTFDTDYGDRTTDGTVVWECRPLQVIPSNEMIKDFVLPFDDVRLFKSLTVFQTGADATHYHTVSYSIDGGLNWTSLTKHDASPSETQNFAASIESALIILRFTVTCPLSDLPPVLVNFHLESVSTQASRAKWTMVVRVSDNILLKKNIQSNSTIAAYQTFIDLMRDNECTLGDREGTEHTVNVRVTREWEDIDFENGRPSRFFQFECVEA